MPQLDWNATIDSIRDVLPNAQFQNWFKPLEFIRSDETSIVLGVPSRFHEEWLKNHYADQLAQAIHKQCGANLQLEFEVLAKENVEASKSPQVVAPHSTPRPVLRIVDPSEKLENQELSPATLNLPQFTSPLLEMDFNHVSFQCARLFSEGIEKQINPLILVAGVGMGKTHLLSEIGHTIHKADNQTRIRYTNAESFTAEMVRGIRANDILSFKKKYREDTDILLFDDVQGLTKRMRTQEELLHIFNEILAHGGRVAFTSTIPIHRLEEFIDPLKSRLLSGVIAEVKTPTFEERVQILAQTCLQNEILVEEPFLRTLADKGQKDIRELVGTLLRVHLQSKLENRTLDGSFLSEGGWAHESQKESITMEEIIALVETNYGVYRTELISKSRKSQTAWARQVAMYLARHFTLLPLEDIGKIFGRDHATVIHAFQKVTETMENQASRRYEVEFLKQKLQNRAPRNVPIL